MPNPGLTDSAASPVGGLEVIQDTHDDLNANVNIQVSDTDVADGNPVPTEELVRTASSWTTLMNAQVFDDAVSITATSEYSVTNQSAIWTHIYVSSTNNPTNIRVLPQFEDDAQWCDFEEGYWASLYWEDTAVSAGVYKSFLLPCGGQDNVRFMVTATGTSSVSTFTVTIKGRYFLGNFGVAHA